jgi:uncharacterized protein
MQTLNLKVDRQNLAATLIKPRNLKAKNPALIFVHGWKSNQQGNIKRAKEISKLGFICLTIDLRGHGKSQGKIDQYSVKDHLKDIKAAYKYLLDNPDVDREKIGIIGSSYGGNLSAIAANYLKFKWLVLRVPALYVDKYFGVPTEELIGKDVEGKAFRSSDSTPETSLALKGVADFKGEILIVESEKDEVIPHRVIENYLRFIPDKDRLTYKVMKGATHSLETEEQEREYIEILKDWLLEKSAELEVKG